MTQNQLKYWANVETQRANRAMESENFRHNVTSENETRRSNLAREGETNRHNLVAEQLSGRQLEETKRSNRAQERLGSERNAISASNVRLGYANLTENTRHNVRGEELTAQSNATQQRQAATAEKNASTNRISALNSMRHDLVTEQHSGWDLILKGLGNAGQLVRGVVAK